MIKMPDTIEKKSGESKEVMRLAYHYMEICYETKNWWKGFEIDCIIAAKNELGENNDEDLENGDQHR